MIDNNSGCSGNNSPVEEENKACEVAIHFDDRVEKTRERESCACRKGQKEVITDYILQVWTHDQLARRNARSGWKINNQKIVSDWFFFFSYPEKLWDKLSKLKNNRNEIYFFQQKFFQRAKELKIAACLRKSIGVRPCSLSDWLLYILRINTNRSTV